MYWTQSWTVTSTCAHFVTFGHFYSLTQDVANIMTSSIIGSRIDYCNSLLVGISEQNLDRLQWVQSKAALIVCNAGHQVTSSDVLYSLHWLPVRRRIKFKTATLCFKAVKLGNPLYVKNMLKPYEPLRSLHSSTMDLLTVPRTDTSFGLRRFSVAGPRIWNGLPHELLQCDTFPCFKSHLKAYYFRHHMYN